MTLLCCKLSSWLTNLTLAIQASSPWRNWLARSTVNREVGSSSLPGEEIVSAIFFPLPPAEMHTTLIVNHYCSYVSLPRNLLKTLLIDQGGS